ncbi:MAG: ABC transporter ATP-binding protein [Candidatus Dormibacteraceae bacterium]
MGIGTPPAIAIERLTKRFGKLTAVNGLTIEVSGGQVVGFLGPNGAGKTTTIRTLMGFIRPTSGRVTILGGQPGQDTALRGRIGYLPGDFRMDPGMTGNDLFGWFGQLRGGLNRSRVRALTDRLQLDSSRPYRDLSKGNRQKIGLVQAFMHDPQVLILDEPTTGLDPLIQREFLELVREAAARGAAVLFSTHVLPEVERVADAVAIIRAGRLIALSAVSDLLDHARHRLEFRFSAPITRSLFAGVPGVVEIDVSGQTATVAVDGAVDKVIRAALMGPSLIRVSSAGDELEDLFISLYNPAQEVL